MKQEEPQLIRQELLESFGVSTVAELAAVCPCIHRDLQLEAGAA